MICPSAEAKLFVTASAEVRAGRRYKELAAKGGTDSLEQVLADVRERDARDRDRSAAPLKPAEDAVVIDTTELSIEDATRAAISSIETLRGLG